ncbi:type II toxin-antitoxin system PemK/MazF family toxin [Frankia sp. Cppng1_Ct_nod]|uniref:type II toxin-antitoxin system PemK/MazF family toxin n=1 Tax=Frankia sp. Cppng1_Ct_nod TaxID=2897162 RepID=UPI001040E708|nr:type II toxin-antitoxin system PemK/MazF family toxin [Frankia sp. Cppng1_Ct_nod]
MIKRGDLWWADLGEPRGSAPALRQPVVVIQADSYNRSRLRTIVVAAVTTNLRLAAMPGNVFLPATVTSLSEDSVVNVTQIATLDRSDLDRRIGEIPSWLMADVERGLHQVLAL